MSSTSDLIVTGSKLVLVTVTENRNVPPGSGREPGRAVFTTTIVGGTSVIPTLASSVAVAGLFSLSRATAVTMSTCWAPALPKKVPAKEQVNTPPAWGPPPSGSAAITCPTAPTQVLLLVLGLAAAFRSPY